jgi:hypothetical protein
MDEDLDDALLDALADELFRVTERKQDAARLIALNLQYEAWSQDPSPTLH